MKWKTNQTPYIEEHSTDRPMIKLIKQGARISNVKKKVSTPERGRVGDDIRQSQDDGGIVQFVHFYFSSVNLWLKFRGRVASNILPQQNCNFVSRELRGQFFWQENDLQRSMTYVWKGRRRSSGVA